MPIVFLVLLLLALPFFGVVVVGVVVVAVAVAITTVKSVLEAHGGNFTLMAQELPMMVAFFVTTVGILAHGVVILFYYPLI